MNKNVEMTKNAAMTKDALTKKLKNAKMLVVQRGSTFIQIPREKGFASGTNWLTQGISLRRQDYHGTFSKPLAQTREGRQVANVCS
jgi:hypothetical protein